LPDRIRATLIALVTLAAGFATPLAVRAATAPKVVIIVGPTGGVTPSYRSQADQIASTAAADGATVVKVYSPNATWAKVKAAVNGANIVIYLGHGNGYPNPYSTTFMPDRTDGWGLNTTTTHGDADSWSAGTLVYCGEKALTGALTSTDGANQWKYCGGSSNTDGITPAAGWVMIYANACYAPGASEPGTKPGATSTQALQRVSYYSRKVLSPLGASGYFATDHGAAPLVHDLLTHAGTTYGAIYAGHVPSGVTVADYAHQFISGDRVKLGHRSTDPYFTYAFAGDPSRTFSAVSSSPAATAPTVVSRSPLSGATGQSMSAPVTVRFSEPVTGVGAGTMVLRLGSTVVPATVTYNALAMLAVLQPVRPLAPMTTYSMALSGSIRNASGVSLAFTSWSFKTAWAESYSPARSLAFAAGTYTGYKFSSTGAVAATHAYTLTHASSAPTSKRSAVTGQTGGWYYVTSGVWAGYWMREATSITLS
jgi:Bacterial Ig-like domain